MGQGDEMVEADGHLARVLVLADDTVWWRTTSALLRAEWFDVALDPSGAMWFDPVVGARHDIALVDLTMRSRPSVGVCAELRARTIAPILVIGASDHDADILSAFAAGADSFAVVTNRPHELVARIRALLRRASTMARRTAQTVEPSMLWTNVAAAATTLSSVELDLLNLLMSRAGRVVTRRELTALLPSDNDEERALDLYVRRIREKLEVVDRERRVVTVRSVGFRYEPDPAPRANVPTAVAG